MDYTNASNAVTIHGENGYKGCEPGKKGTFITPEAMNSIQSEIMSAIVGSGQDPIPFDDSNPESYSQLWKAMQIAAAGQETQKIRPLNRLLVNKPVTNFSGLPVTLTPSIAGLVPDDATVLFVRLIAEIDSNTNLAAAVASKYTIKVNGRHCVELENGGDTAPGDNNSNGDFIVPRAGNTVTIQASQSYNNDSKASFYFKAYLVGCA